MNVLERRSLTGLVSLYATRMLGLFMVLPVLSVFSDSYQGATTLLIGVALGVYGLTQSLFQIPLGILSDKIGRKPIILGGMLVFLVGSVVAALSTSVYGLILGRALQGAGAVASTIMALLSDLTTEQNRTKAMAAVGGSIGIAFALAMVGGPVVASYAGVSGIFWLTALLAALGVLVVIFWIPAPVRVSRIASREALAMPSLFWSTLCHRDLLRLNLGVFILHLVQMASWVSVPWVLSHSLGFEISRHWLLYLLTMGFGFVAMLPFMIIAERKRILKWVFAAAVLLLAIAEGSLYMAEGRFWLFVLGMFLFFMAFNLLEASLPSLVSKVSPSGSRGTAMGIYSSSQFFGAFLGGVVGGFVAQHYGHPAVFVMSVVAVVIWLLIALTMAPPRHWASVVVSLQEDELVSLPVADIEHSVAGVEEVTFFPEQQLMYLKVDKAVYDPATLEKILGRPLPA
jgi:MFS family permease